MKRTLLGLVVSSWFGTLGGCAPSSTLPPGSRCTNQGPLRADVVLKNANISAGGPTVVDATLAAATLTLDAVVTTATGLQRKVELANSTTQIAVAGAINEMPVSNLGGLLSPTGMTPISVKFTAVGGSWQVDDLYVDPYRRN